MASRPHILIAAPTIPRVESWGWVAAVMAAALLVGVASATLPLVAFLVAGLVVVAGLASVDLSNVERGVVLTLVSGAMILGKGWANLGIPGGVPIPATEILFIPMAAIGLMIPRTRLDHRTLLPLALFATLVFIRFLFDYPVWGVYAIRDTTSTIEAFILGVGYRAVARDGVAYWVKRMRYIAAAVLLYGASYSFLPQLEGAGPNVGLQRSGSLFDSTGVKFSVIAMGLYFIAFGRGWTRITALGLVTGLLGLYQARTLYIMLPLTVLVLGWAMHQFGRLLRQVVPAVLIAALLVSWAASSAIQGTEGPVSTDFLTSHLKTLVGEEGPNAATIDARGEFIDKTFEFVGRSPGTVLVGVGLGPDLTFGKWTGDEGQLVRNPHNSYLEVFARTGVLGISLWIWLLLSCLIPIALRARSGEGPTERFCAWTLAASVVYLGVAAAQPILAFPYGSVPLFFLLGMGLAASRLPAGPATPAALPR